MATLARPKHRPEHLKLEDVFKIEGDTNPEDLEDLEKYFQPFAVPVKNIEGDQVCIGCGEHFGGLMANLGFGVAIEWGMVHGEGTCNKCGWPYRGMHYIKDRHGKELANIRNLFLAYHPDNVEVHTG